MLTKQNVNNDVRKDSPIHFVFCARLRPTDKRDREQFKHITAKKLAEFHNQFVLLTMV